MKTGITSECETEPKMLQHLQRGHDQQSHNFFFEVSRQALVIKVSGSIFDNDRSVTDQCSPDC